MNVQPNLQMDKPAFLAWVDGREERYELAASEYLGLSSVVAYLVLSQEEIKGWIYFRDAGLPGGPKIVVGEQETISVPALGIELPLAEIYADIEFE